jgi:hypothetical protein
MMGTVRPLAEEVRPGLEEAPTRYPPEFMAFYFPDAHAAIDWSQPYRFPDQEPARVARDAELGQGIADRLERQLWSSIRELERNANMPYVRSVQRIGREEGRLEGRQEGRLEGRMEGEAALLRRLLVRRFGALPEWADARLARASTEELETWSEHVLEAVTLTEVLEHPGRSDLQ